MTMSPQPEDGGRLYHYGSSCPSLPQTALKSRFELPSRDLRQGLYDEHTVISDTDTSDIDSLWSGSTPSSWNSGSSMSEFRSSELYLSSIPSQKHVLEQDIPTFPGLDLFLSGNRPSKIVRGLESSGTGTISNTANLPDFQSNNHQSGHSSPRHHIDYLSYQWTLDEVSASWKFINLNRGKYPSGLRLENAAWRGWEKCRSDLRTVHPESLNWLRECDITWLYGPYKRAPRGMIERVYSPLSKDRSIDAPPSILSPVKPILKSTTCKDTITEDVVLLRSLSAGSLANRPASVVQWCKKPSAQHASFVRSGSISNQEIVPGLKLKRQKHVRFDMDLGQYDEKKTTSNKESNHLQFNLRLKEEDLTRTANRHYNDSMPNPDMDDSTAYDLERVYTNGRVRSPPPDFVRSQRKQKQGSKIFFLDDSEDEELDFSDVDEESENEGTIMTDFITSSSMITSSNGTSSTQLHFKYPSLPESSCEEGIIKSSSSVPTTSWRNPHAKLQRTSSGELCGKTLEVEDVSQYIGSSNLGSDANQTSSLPCPHVASRSPNLQFRSSIPAHTISRLLSLHTQETGDVDLFQFGSVPPETHVEQEEEEFFFGDMVDLDFVGTDADLAQLILHNRSMDWALLKTERHTKSLPTAESTQAAILPPLTSTHKSQKVKSSNGSKPQVVTNSNTTKVSEPMTEQLDLSESCRKNDESKVSSNTELLQNILQESIATKLPLDKFEQWIPDEDFNPDHHLQATDQLLGAHTASIIEPSSNEFESMTESYGDDSIESIDGESLYGDIYQGDLSSHTKAGCLGSALSPIQQALVNKIMGEFWIMFNQTWTSGLRQCTTQHTGTTSSQHSSGSGVPTSSSPSSSRKRQRREDEDPESGKGKKVGGTDDGTDVMRGIDEVIRFACPFRKHEPHLYNVYDHSVCALSSWPSIARVKESLWNKSVAYDLGRRLPKVKATKIDGEKFTLSYFQTKRFPHLENFEPVQEEVQMSPDTRELARYEAYMRHELPRVVRRNIEEAIRQALGPLQSSLIGDVAGIVRDSQDAVFRSYRQSQGLDNQQSTALETIPTIEFAQPTNEAQTASPSNGLITALFQAPPSQPEAEILSSITMDDVQIGHGETPSSTTGMRSEPDSGYSSEQVLSCGCWSLCTCSDLVEMKTSVHEGDSWNDWAVFPDWNLLDSIGATFER